MRVGILGEGVWWHLSRMVPIRAEIPPATSSFWSLFPPVSTLIISIVAWESWFVPVVFFATGC